MRYRRLGTTGVRVSQLGLGTMPFGGETDEDEAAAIVAACLDAGINQFDTADVYSTAGRRRCSAVSSAPVRDDVLIATKVGFPSGAGRQPARRLADPHPAVVEGSLRRLGTDRIDLYYLHRFDHRTDLDHTLRALDALVAAGKILYLGVSNFAAWQVATALGRWRPQRLGADRRRCSRCTTSSSARSRSSCCRWPQAARSGRVPVQPARRRAAVGQVRHAAGLRRGPGRRRPDVQLALPRRGVGTAPPPSSAAIAAEVGCHPATLAVAWVGGHPAVTAPLIGGRTLDQLRPSLAAADLELDDELRARITALTPTPPLATDRTGGAGLTDRRPPPCHRSGWSFPDAGNDDAQVNEDAQIGGSAGEVWARRTKLGAVAAARPGRGPGTMNTLADPLRHAARFHADRPAVTTSALGRRRAPTPSSTIASAAWPR